MKMFSVLILIFSVLFASCDYFFHHEETPASFRWVKKGNQLTYDLSTPDHNIKEYRKIEIRENPSQKDKLVFHEIVPEINNDPYRGKLLTNIFFHVQRSDDGLYTATCYSCGMGACFSSFRYLIVPAAPSRDQNIHQFLCKDKIGSNDIIISTDSIITVPLGKFTTLVINDTLNNNIKFWNEETGLIRIDNYTASLLTDTLILKLSNKNY